MREKKRLQKQQGLKRQRRGWDNSGTKRAPWFA